MGAGFVVTGFAAVAAGFGSALAIVFAEGEGDGAGGDGSRALGAGVPQEASTRQAIHREFMRAFC